MAGHLQNKDLSFSASMFAVFLCTLFGTNAVAIKISLTGMGAMTTAGLRFVLALIVLYLWAFFRREKLILKRGQIMPIMVTSLCFVTQITLVYLGLSRTNAGKGTLLINTQPLFVLILAHFFIPGDQISFRKVICMVLGFTGVVVLLSEHKAMAFHLRSGDLMLIGSSMVWAANSTYTKHILKNITPIQINFYNVVVAVPVFLTGGACFDQTMIHRVDMPVLLSIFYQGAVTASFGYVAWTSMLRKYGATALHSFVFIMPLSGVAMSAFVLNEPLEWRLLMALALISISIMINGYHRFQMSNGLPASLDLNKHAKSRPKA